MKALDINTILQGDTLEVLKTLPDESVDSIITSPPYYGLRDYGVDGQIGLEKTLDEYLSKMLLITSELKRVLKKTGTMWLNWGDAYNSAPTGNTKITSARTGYDGVFNRLMERHTNKRTTNVTPKRKLDMPEKCQMLQNYRMAIRMVDEQGWILRNQIIWHKPNCMPSSVKDRFTVDFEPVFFFSKNKKYWFEMQYEQQSPLTLEVASHYKNPVRTQGKKADKMGGMYPIKRNFILPLGRNKRCVWKISTHPFKEAHFATFPEKLIEPMIKAGCPEFICNKCGKAREKILKYSGGTIGKGWHDHTNDGEKGMLGRGGIPASKDYKVEDLGYTDCGCNSGFHSGIVLDPFMGSGTTAYVSRKLGRNYLGIELNPNYIEMANKRLAQEVLL